MMKYIKRCILAVLILIFLLLTSVFVLVTFYKKEMGGVLINNLKTNFGLTLNVNAIEVSLFDHFPRASIKLESVYLDNDLYKAHVPLLKAGSIAISFNIRKLLKKEFEINTVALQDAEINLVRNKNGSKNFQFSNKDTLRSKLKSHVLDFDIHKITIENTAFKFINVEKHQLIDITFIDNIIKLKKQAEGFTVELKGNVTVGGLLFNVRKGKFLKNTDAELNITGVLFTGNKSFFIHDPSFVEIDNIKYSVNSFIQFGEEKKLALKIESKNVLYYKGIKLVNKKIADILSNFAIDKPIDLSILVITNLGVKQDPIILVKVKSSNNTVAIGNSKVRYSNVSFTGTILSLDSSKTKGDEEHAKIMFSSVKGNIYEIPFIALIKVNSFTDPYIDITTSLFIDAGKVKLQASNEFDLKGTCVANVHYAGSTLKLNKREFLSPAMILKANLAFKNFSYKERHKPYVYTVNGKTSLTNTELKFDRLVLKTAGGNVVLAGKVNNFAQYVLGFTPGLKININAYADLFNVNPFITQKTTDSTSSKAPQASVKQLSEESGFDFNVSLKAKKMLVRKVIAENAYMNIAYKNKVLNVRSLTINTCEGKLNANATISNLKRIKAEINVEEINVSKLFEQFENFGQQAIQSKQLKGKISVNATFDAELDGKMEIIPASMSGDVKLKLKDGHLLEYEPLQNISSFIFHNRDFNDITFSEINESFKLNGYEMRIDELEVASNVLNLFVSGTYNVKSLSNINLVIPWSNLKRRGKNYIPKSSGLSAEDAKGLKLNYAGTSKKMKLSLGHK